jgi:DegV family protein with EDD domain
MKVISKENVGLIVDDICSLPDKIIEQYSITIVKTKLFFPEVEEFPERNLYQIMRETKAHPKTSAPSPGDYFQKYQEALKSFHKILVITLSSKLSATYNSAFQAKQLMPDPSRVVIFDTLQAAAPEGLLVLEAVKLIKENKNLKTIVKILEKLRSKVRLFVFLETTYWVEKIGRMNHLQGTAFKFLKGLGIQPYIGIKKGKVALTGFNFWTRDPLKAIFNQLKGEARKTKIKVGINYTDNIPSAYKLKEKLEKEPNTKISFISLVPPIVGANSGPGTLLAGCLLYD